ncbi:chromate transporter [Aquincola sp. S2]|uniref:Chromate transporter n=1 Tax=Pseudaquabacterium terrae TaxID=2732868 RepID=A0ABX2EJL7_9BURK|nr:chromate transporter [Aquabacterium terrae]NRF68771.1 chromate transporter [Aquabacterium terrae]
MAEGTPGPLAEPPPRRPQSTAELFRVFNRLALQGFGGVLPIAHRELVEREQWLTPTQFVELLALGQVLPGPNIVNMSIIFGDRHFGWRGALAASAGLMTVPLAIVLLLATLYTQVATQELAIGALRGMGVVSAGLVIATAVKLRTTLQANPLGQPASYAIGALTLALVGGLRWPLVWVVLGLGGAAMALAWWRIRVLESSR